MESVLVTGGCGFLGSAIAREIAGRGIKLRVLALPGEPTDNIEGLDVELVRGNVLERADCERAVQGVDTVFHAAAIYKAWMPDPTLMYDVNTSGTFNMLEAAGRAGVGKVIYTASIVALGRPPLGELADESTTYEAWEIDFPYSRAKYHSRKLAQDFARWGLDVRVVCPGVVFGPGDIAPTPSGRIIINLVRGKAPPVYMDGGANYVDVRDAAHVHVLVAEKGKAGEIYLASAHNLSNRELLEAVTRAAGLKQRRLAKIPTSLGRAIVNAMERQAKKTGKEPPLSRNFFEYGLKPNYYTNKKAVSELGATFRPLDETIRDAIAYFRKRGKLPPS
jgi:dihydroflavonol-4-reductase